MASKGVLYGVAAVFVALLIVTGTVAAYYFGQYQQASSQSQRYVDELDAALSSYRSLSNHYNASLGDYNRTLSLLADAVAALNTSTPAYYKASIALSSLWSSYQSLASSSGRRAIVYEVHMLVDYGNGSRRWYNDTGIQPGWNGYLATLVLLNGNVQATWYPQYGEHFVIGVGGVSNTNTKYWFLLTYNRTASWQVAQVGADQIQIFNGTTFAWLLCAPTPSYTPACPLP